MRAIQNQTELPYSGDKILKGSLEHRFYIFLNDLYKDYSFTSLRKYFRKHQIGAFRTGILIELGFIEQIRFGQYVWNGNQPTVADAIKLTDTIRKKQKNYNEKYKKKKRSKKDAQLQMKKMQNNSFDKIDENQYINIKEAEKYTNKTSRTIRYHIAKYKEKINSEKQINKMFKYKEDNYGNYVLYINKDFLNSIYGDEIKKSENKEVKKIETKKEEIKSKHISFLWGMFKLEIKK